MTATILSDNNQSEYTIIMYSIFQGKENVTFNPQW